MEHQCGICGLICRDAIDLQVHANTARCSPRGPFAYTDLPTNVVGTPVGFSQLEPIAAGGVRTFRTCTMLFIRLSRLRWFGGTDGLYLVDARVGGNGTQSLHAGPGTLGLSLAGHGVWRFPPELVQVSQSLVVLVENKSARTGWLGGLSFWGVVRRDV
jgi:hypothetical protein